MMSALASQFAPEIPHVADYFSLEEEDFTIIGSDVNAVFTEAVQHYLKLLEGYCGLADISMAEVIRDRCWEELNTGYWADVPLVWRTLYSFAALLCSVGHLHNYLVSCRTDVKQLVEALRSCDMGLIMGKPLAGDVLTTLASRCHEELANFCSHASNDCACKAGRQQSGPAASGTANACFMNHVSWVNPVSPSDPPAIRHALDREECPSVEKFVTSLFGQRAAVLTQCVSHWPALQWTVPRLVRAAGHRTVPVEVGARYTDAGWSQRLMPLGEFVSRYVTAPEESSGPGYLAQYELFSQVPELRRDIAVPDYCHAGDKPGVHVNVWLGPAGTVSPLHHDPKHNCLVQVFGFKYIRIYHPKETDKLYPYDAPMLNNTSRADVEKQDLDQFPLLEDASYTETVLAPGEMLYMPPGWWHYVRSLSASCSVSFWFE